MENDITYDCVVNNDVEFLRIATELGFPKNNFAMETAMNKKYVACLKFCMENQYSDYGVDCEIAAKLKDIKILEMCFRSKKKNW